MLVAIASDHAGISLKAELKDHLSSLGATSDDLGTHETVSVDYPDFASAVAEKIRRKECAFGILICGSGIGMSMAANRHKGIRAALCTDGLMAELSRRHNDANILVLGARLTGIEIARECVTRFLGNKFEGGRHAVRTAKLDNMEN